jgi:adenosylhomocysteine nucleosidase
MRVPALLILACLSFPAPIAAQSAAPPASPRPIVLQGAMDVEVASLVARLGDARPERIGAWTFWHGAIDGYPVIVAKTLKGVSNAAASTAIAIERYRPAAIINQGTAGGLDASLKLHDIVLGTASINLGAFRSPRRALGAGSSTLDWVPLDLTAPDGKASASRTPARFAGDDSLLAAARAVVSRHTRGRVVEGVIGTSDVWNDELDRLSRLNRDYGTLVEEMETASAAQVAAQANIPFLGIRIVSDNAPAGIAFDPKTAEACEDYVYEVARSYVARSLRASAGQAPEQPSLVGAWRLVSWDERLKDGTVRRNPRTTGSLLYADSGRMCAVIIDPDRPVYRSRPDEAQVRAAFDGLVAYCGVYELHAPEGFVVHHVDIEKTPSAIGIHRKRWFVFEGANRLVLRIDAAENGPAISESRLTWERVTR